MESIIETLKTMLTDAGYAPGHISVDDEFNKIIIFSADTAQGTFGSSCAFAQYSEKFDSYALIK